MSDQITAFTRFNNPNGTVHRYEITFSFDDVDVPAELSTIYMAGQVMTDPNDVNEAKTKAMALASQLKALYSGPIDVPGMTGVVTL